MTPAPPQLAPPRARIRAILTTVLGVVLLAALLLPARDPVTHRLAAEWRPSAELAGVLFLIAMAALASPPLVARRDFAFALALLVVAAALLNLADAATPSLLGRDLNLYWDLRHLPSLFGLAREFGRPVERLGGGRPASYRRVVGGRGRLLDMAPGAGHLCRPADCHRRRGLAGYRTRRHIVLTRRTAPARDRAGNRYRPACRGVRNAGGGRRPKPGCRYRQRSRPRALRAAILPASSGATSISSTSNPTA